MAQQLKVFQDPSIVQNVPTTPMEQLQLATEQKAAQMAAERNGAQPTAVKPTASQLQALKVVANALVSPSQRNANDIVRDIPATGTANTARPYTTDAANALDYNRLGLTATAREPAPLAAIDAATVMRPSMRPGSFFANGALPFLGGDPGIPTHVGGDNGLYGRPAQGFATVPNGPPIMRSAAPAARQPVMVAAPPPPNVTNNINRFLSEQGVNTQGMTAGEQANAMRNAMGGSHNGEFH